MAVSSKDSRLQIAALVKKFIAGSEAVQSKLKQQSQAHLKTYSGLALFGLAGCGGGGEQGGGGSIGSYVPPPANYEPPVYPQITNLLFRLI